MHYTVQAQLIESTAKEFYQKLTDGTILSQKPDGLEIVASMKRARVGQDGIIRWSEVCYCPTPLEHERKTVLDHYFTEFKTKEVQGYVTFEGEVFMDYLARSAA